MSLFKNRNKNDLSNESNTVWYGSKSAIWFYCRNMSTTKKAAALSRCSFDTAVTDVRANIFFLTADKDTAVISIISMWQKKIPSTRISGLCSYIPTIN